MLEFDFADGVLDEDDRARVRLALCRIEAAGEGAWPHPVGHVKVRKVFGDGRSGSLALHVELSTGQVVLSRVLKVDRIDVMARDWSGWQEIRRFANAFFAPVFAASHDVIDPGRRGPYDCGAVVYDDAAEFDGDATATPQSLEEIARDPARVDETVAMIERLFKGVAVALHNAHKVDDQLTSLARMNLRLGPALEIRSDGGSGVARLPWQILRRTLTGGADDIAPGERIHFELSEHDPLTIDVDGKPVRVGSGTIEVSRGRARRRLLPKPALPCADPFAALPDVLSKTTAGRVTSRSHGDLNARNVLVVGGRPYLIDYAAFAADLPQQFDFSWLEVSLLRDVYADRAPAGLIRLQRALAVGSRLLHLGVAGEEVLGSCRELVPVDDHDALRVLLTIREQAHLVYPQEAQPVWWRDHLAQLLLSAHRTLKWPDAMQSAAKLHAVTAAAAVATEWLTDGDPFEHWDRHSDQAKSVLGRHLRRNLRKDSSKLAEQLRVEHYIDLAANDGLSAQTLLSATKHTVVSGPRGSGKTAVLREFGHRLLADESAPVPMFVRAQDLQQSTIDAEEARLGVRHLILDDATPDQLTELRGRYPAMPILASGEPTDGFEQVLLLGLDERAIEIYLWRRVPEVGVDRLMGTLLNDQAWRRLDIQHPRTLSLLAAYVTLHGIPHSPVDLRRAMLLDKVDGDEQALAAGEAVALALLNQVSPGPIHPKLVESGLVITNDGRAYFAESANRDHLAALGLRREGLDLDRVRECPDQIKWLDTFTEFVRLPDVSTQEVKDLIDAISFTYWKARLLAAASHCPTETLDAFVADQLAQLYTTTDDFAMENLAVLRQYGTLSHIALDSTAPRNRRVGALHTLKHLQEMSRPGGPYRAATTALVTTLEALLTHETNPGLREIACSTVALAKLRELGLLVAEQISESSPWSLNLAAMKTLQKIGVARPDALVRAYTAACSARLTESCRQLRATGDARLALARRVEQVDLVNTLVGEPRRSWYLQLRFGFGVDAVELGEAPEIDGEPDQWLTLVEHGSAEEAALAAHHLLADNQRSEILARIGDAPSDDRMLIAAEALGAGDLGWAEDLVLRTLPQAGPTELEGPAAVLVAVFRHNRMRGIRLALRAARVVRERDLAERRFWPWSMALGICHGRPEEHEALLNEGEVELAIDALSSYGFLLNGEPRPDHVFGDAAKQKLLHAVTEENLVDWAHAAATVGLAKAVPVIRNHIANGRSEPVLAKALEYLANQE